MFDNQSVNEDLDHNVIADPDFSAFQEPEMTENDFVTSPFPSTAAVRVFRRLNVGKRVYKKRAKKNNRSLEYSLASTFGSEIFDDDDGPDDSCYAFDDPVIQEDKNPPPKTEVNKEKSWPRWIFEETIAFCVCLVYLLFFNILAKIYL